MRATIACAALLAASPAAAQEPLRAVPFSWVRGDGADRCPSPADMMTAVRARVGRDPFSPAATTSAEASVERARREAAEERAAAVEGARARGRRGERAEASARARA